MVINIGLKGFGRIGHLLARLIEEDPSLDMRITAISEINRNYKLNNEYVARQHLANLVIDTAYGKFNGLVSEPQAIDANTYRFELNGKEAIMQFNTESVNHIGWDKYKVDVLIDASLTADRPQSQEQVEELRRCLQGSVKKAVITCPHKFVDATLIMGVNDQTYDSTKHQVISASSCTGNAGVPITNLINQKYGIIYGDIETIHPNQNFESAVDGVGLTAGMARGSIGNVKNVDTAVINSILEVLPNLKGRLNTKPLSYRTPTASGCFMRYDFITQTAPVGGAAEINKLIKAAADGPLKGIIGYQEPLMGVTPPNSLDVKGTTYAVLMSPRETTVYTLPNGQSIIRLLGLHDTELGYSACVLRTIKKIMAKD